MLDILSLESFLCMKFKTSVEIKNPWLKNTKQTNKKMLFDKESQQKRKKKKESQQNTGEMLCVWEP